MRWDVLDGTLEGPQLTDATNNDRHSPYLADPGFFSQDRLPALMNHPDSEPRSAITRIQRTTAMYWRDGTRGDLLSTLPKEEGQACEFPVLIGKRAKIPMRLIAVRVPHAVAEERRSQLRNVAREHSRQPNEQCLALADWMLLGTNVPHEMLSLEDVLICSRLRWPIELLLKLWKQEALVDEWRTTKKKPYRILTERFAKRCVMVIQPWVLQAGWWDDPSPFLSGGGPFAPRRQSHHDGSARRRTGEDRGLPSATTCARGRPPHPTKDPSGE